MKLVRAVFIVDLAINSYSRITADDFSAGNAGFTFTRQSLPQLTRKNIQKIRIRPEGAKESIKGI